MDILAQTYFGDILHIISQALLVPTIILLILLILFAAFCLGSVIFECLTERRHFKVRVPAFLDALTSASEATLPQVVGDAELLGSQKHMLLTLWDYRCLPVDSHVALAKRLMEEMEDRHNRMLLRTQIVSKVAPMLGLMGTLIPLGPGIVSLGVGDTLTLSSSLLVAFDTTVAGLVVALVTFVITKIRQRWYEDYATAMEAAVTAILETVDTMRQDGRLRVSIPTQTALPYALRRRGAKRPEGV